MSDPVISTVSGISSACAVCACATCWFCACAEIALAMVTNDAVPMSTAILDAVGFILILPRSPKLATPHMIDDPVEACGKSAAESQCGQHQSGTAGRLHERFSPPGGVTNKQALALDCAPSA